MDMTSSLLRDREKNEETHNDSCEFSSTLRDTLEQILASYHTENISLKSKTNALFNLQQEHFKIQDDLKEVKANEEECRHQMHTMSF